MSVAVVIVNYRTPALAERCLDALLTEREAVPDIRVVVVDGGSGDGSADKLSSVLAQDRFRDWSELIALPINGGFGYANNAAIASLLDRSNAPEFILLLNPDTVIEPGAVVCLASHLRRHPDVGAVGSQLIEMDGSESGSAFPFPSLRGELSRGASTGLIDRLLRVGPPAFPPSATDFEADWVTGASVMFRASSLRDSGLFDDGFFLYHEEIELMWRMRQEGWSIRHEPRSRVRHVGGAATGVHGRPVIGSLLPRRPAYWYQSRRRYFALTRGRAAAAMAAGLWVFGYLIWSLRRLLGLTRRQPFMNELRDVLRFGIPWRQEVRSQSISVQAQRPNKPAWMTWHE